MYLTNLRAVSVAKAESILKDLATKSLNGELTDSKAFLSRSILGHTNEFIKMNAGVYGELLNILSKYEWQCNFTDVADKSLRVALLEKYIMEDFFPLAVKVIKNTTAYKHQLAFMISDACNVAKRAGFCDKTAILYGEMMRSNISDNIKWGSYKVLDEQPKAAMETIKRFHIKNKMLGLNSKETAVRTLLSFMKGC